MLLDKKGLSLAKILDTKSAQSEFMDGAQSEDYPVCKSLLSFTPLILSLDVKHSTVNFFKLIKSSFVGIVLILNYYLKLLAN